MRMLSLMGSFLLLNAYLILTVNSAGPNFGGGCSDPLGPMNHAATKSPAAKTAIRYVSVTADEEATDEAGKLAKAHLVGWRHHSARHVGGGCAPGFGTGVQNYGCGPAVGHNFSPVYWGQAQYAAPAPLTTSPQAFDYGCQVIGQSPTQGSPSSAGVIVQTDRRELMDCGPVTTYQVVLEPKYFTESKAVCTTEYQNETRYRTRTVNRTVPVEVNDFRTVTVMVPRSETKSVEYTVLIPQTGEKTVDIVETVPVWNEVIENYVVKVPTVVDVPEEYTVQVPQLNDEQFTYTVYVPQSQTETRMQSVSNAVPVTKTRTVQTCQPVTHMQSVTKDYGHWEVHVEEVAVAAAPYTTSCGNALGGGGCGSVATACQPMHCGARHAGCCGHAQTGCGASLSCGSYGTAYGAVAIQGGCGAGYAQPANCQQPAFSSTQTVSRRVWVPNVVTEEVPVVENVTQTQEVTYTVYEQQTEQVPYECTYLIYRPEERTGTRKVVNYVDEKRTRNRKVVQYNDETRTRTLKQLTYKQQTRSETIPFVSYTSEKRTKEIAYTINVPETKVEPFTTTRYETIAEEISEAYTVSVPVATTKEVQVQVCRMVPKLVPVTIYPCANTNQGIEVGNGCAGCGTPNLAPAMTNGCAGCVGGCAGCQ